MGTLAVVLGLGILALLAGGRRGEASPRGVTAQTRARVRETLATPDARARTIPVEPAPARVDPDRRTGGQGGATGTGTAARPATASSGSQTAWGAAREAAAATAATRDAEARARARGRAGESTETTGAPYGSRTAAPTTGTARDPRGTVTFPTVEDVTRLDDAEPDAPAEAPSGPAPEEARRLASGTANAIRSRSSGWRNRLRAFQRAAGISPDGRYGGLSYNALIYYGIRNPPAATSAPRASAPEANYVDRVIAPPEGTGE